MIGFPKNETDILTHIKNREEQGLLASSGDFSSLLKEQMNHYLSQGLPIKKTEGWRYFPTQALRKSDYCFDEQLSESKNLKTADTFLKDSHLISVKNGEPLFCQNIKGLRLISWKDFLSKKITVDKNIKNKIYDSFRKKRDSFCALSNILSFNGFILIVEESLKNPIEIQYLQGLSEKMKGLNLRVFIFIKKNAQAQILETFYGNTSKNQSFFFNLQTDCFLEEGSALDYFHLDKGGAGDIQMNQFFAQIEKNTKIKKLTLNFNSGISRYSTEVSQEKNSHSDIKGLSVLGENKHCSHKVSAIHEGKNSTSNQLYQSFLFAKARCIFNGMIDIKQKAQKSAAKQLNRNLLFSDQAFAVSCPELEVEADDVTAEHGATVSSLQEQKDLLFYLQSRGLSQEDSYQFILSGIMNEILQNIDKKFAVHFKMLISDHLILLQNQQQMRVAKQQQN